VLEDWEERAFRTRFAGQQAVRLLDEGPIAIRRNPGGELRVYALHAGSGMTGHRAVEIPRTSPLDCIDASADFASIGDIFPKTQRSR
jgi:hypothetical protein